MKRRVLQWTLCFLVSTAAIAAAGVVLGAVLFPVGGWLFGVDRTAGQLALQGVRDGGFYFGIWAPGTAIVLCVIRAYRRRHSPAP